MAWSEAGCGPAVVSPLLLCFVASVSHYHSYHLGLGEDARRKDTFGRTGRRICYVIGAEVGCKEGEGSGDVKVDIALTGMTWYRGEQRRELRWVGVDEDGEEPGIMNDLDGD